MSQPDDPKGTLHELRTEAAHLAEAADRVPLLRRGLIAGGIGFLVLLVIGVAFSITVSLHTAYDQGVQGGTGVVEDARSQRASDARTDLAYWNDLLAARGLTPVKAPGDSASADQIVEATSAAQAQVLWADLVAARGDPVPGYVAPTAPASPVPGATTTPIVPPATVAPSGPTVVPGPTVHGSVSGGATAPSGGAAGASGATGPTGPTGAQGRTGAQGQAGSSAPSPANTPAPLIKVPTVQLPGLPPLLGTI